MLWKRLNFPIGPFVSKLHRLIDGIGLVSTTLECIAYIQAVNQEFKLLQKIIHSASHSYNIVPVILVQEIFSYLYVSERISAALTHKFWYPLRIAPENKSNPYGSFSMQPQLQLVRRIGIVDPTDPFLYIDRDYRITCSSDGIVVWRCNQGKMHVFTPLSPERHLAVQPGVRQIFSIDQHRLYYSQQQQFVGDYKFRTYDLKTEIHHRGYWRTQGMIGTSCVTVHEKRVALYNDSRVDSLFPFPHSRFICEQRMTRIADPYVMIEFYYPPSTKESRNEAFLLALYKVEKDKVSNILKTWPVGRCCVWNISPHLLIRSDYDEETQTSHLRFSSLNEEKEWMGPSLPHRITALTHTDKESYMVQVIDQVEHLIKWTI
jgi:hypothetical protein